MASERHDRRLFTLGQESVARLGWSGPHVIDRRTFAPLRNRLGVDAQFTVQLRGQSRR
jgi:hypothetical protein